MPNFQKTTIEMDKDKLKEFKKIFPTNGSQKWFFDSCLEEVIKLSIEGKIPELISGIYREAAERAIKRMDEGGEAK